MSLGLGVRGLRGPHVPCLEGQGWGLYSEVQSIKDNGHMGTLRHRMIDMTENMTETRQEFIVINLD